MEKNIENPEKVDPQRSSHTPQSLSVCNSTYAEVLSKGKFAHNDASNNNPASFSDAVNGNETAPSSSHPAMQDSASAIFEESLKNSSDVNSEVELTQSDSFEDNENSQPSDSSPTDKSKHSDSKLSAAEESSVSAVTNSGTDLIYDNGSQFFADEFSESGEESDVEEDTDELGALYPTALKWKFRSENAIHDLPDTVTVLETSHGSKVYLVGTAHFSTESQEDVAKTIRAVQPDIVVIELCKSRVNILSLDEATILEESKNMNFQKIKSAIEQNGFLQGVLYLLLLSMSAHLTKQLGMAPGGEFRRAFIEAKTVPGCLIHLGDRPIHITLQRALATLSWWQKLRIAWYMLRAKDPISKEEVERCKQKDLLEEMLAEMTGEFPELSRVFVRERDIYLTYSLQMSAAPVVALHSPNVPVPSYVVGVVGIGHVPGIKENWGKVSERDIPPIVSVPEPSMSSKVIRQTLRFSLLGLGIYGVYKLIPKSLLPAKYSLNSLPVTLIAFSKYVSSGR